MSLRTGAAGRTLVTFARIGALADRSFSSGVFEYDPGGHAALILNNRGLQRVRELTTQIFGEAAEQVLVDQLALRATGQQEAALSERLEPVLHPDRRCEAAKKQASRLQNAPGLAHYGLEVIVMARKVEHGAAENNISEARGKRHFFDPFHAEVIGRSNGASCAARRRTPSMARASASTA